MLFYSFTNIFPDFAMSQVFSTFAVLSRKESIDAQFRRLWCRRTDSEDAHEVARMAESVDALVSNTSAARHAGSIPAPGTGKGFGKQLIARALLFSEVPANISSAGFREILYLCGLFGVFEKI